MRHDEEALLWQAGHRPHSRLHRHLHLPVLPQLPRVHDKHVGVQVRRLRRQDDHGGRLQRRVSNIREAIRPLEEALQPRGQPDE